MDELIKDAIKTLVGKEKWEKLKSLDINELKFLLHAYHHLGRSKEKFNAFVDIYLNQDKYEIFKNINDAIDLHKKYIYHLERLKKGLMLKKVQEEVL